MQRARRRVAKRRLRPVLDIVSDIGALGFDLQHHNEAAIREAVRLLRAVNKELFDWLVHALEDPEANRG